MQTIRATYLVTCPKERLEEEAQAICLEQTVEVPAALVTDPVIRENVIGKAVKLDTGAGGADDRHVVTIDFNAELASRQISQLLNLLYGNISIKKNIRLLNAHLPESLLAGFAGPNHGIAGIRRLTGVWGRPLLATALKPRGSSTEVLAEIAANFARGGGDIVKDDHNIVDEGYDEFCSRVGAIHDAVQRANEQMNRRCLYLPHLMPPSDEMQRYLDFLARRGVPGVLMCPFITGVDAMRRVAEFHPFVVMAHPALSGAFYRNQDHGVDPGFLLGKICRIAGADASVFPNYGGRFALTKDECMDITKAMKTPMGAMRPGFPAPAGGMSFDRLPSMSAEYGADAIFLIGGALLSHSGYLASSTKAFLDKMNEAFKEERTVPELPVASACEFRGNNPGPFISVMEHLNFNPAKFNWSGRDPVAYKASEELPFRGVARHELIGKGGERTAFELRYFEIEPGGYTSLEKHFHTHTIICARGQGTLVKGGKETPLSNMDIAYVDSMQVHQLRNESSEPFGFFCIVDRDRDRPVKP